MNPLPSHPQASPGTWLGHQPALDGIRGFAVLVVLGHNLQWGWLQGGFLGVDVFFGLSGFLITTLLLEDHARHGQISVRAFFARRFLRLYPALVVLVAVSVLSPFITHAQVAGERVVTVAVSVLGYCSNWLLLTDTQAWFGGMGHTWSLAVEMQFYILWALLLRLATSRGGPDLRLLGIIAAGLAVGSATWREVLSQHTSDIHRIYAGTDTRFDALFLGAGAALWRLRQITKAAGPAGLFRDRLLTTGLEAGCLGALLPMIVLCRQDSTIAGFAAAGAATALLILTVLLSPGSFAARLASGPVLVWFGQLSYSIYLWHVPVAKLLSVERLARFGWPPVLMESVRAAACIAIAAASYYGVERYFLRRKSQLAR